jgi:hypothetical protein
MEVAGLGNLGQVGAISSFSAVCIVWCGEVSGVANHSRVRRSDASLLAVQVQPRRLHAALLTRKRRACGGLGVAPRELS